MPQDIFYSIMIKAFLLNEQQFFLNKDFIFLQNVCNKKKYFEEKFHEPQQVWATNIVTMLYQTTNFWETWCSIPISTIVEKYDAETIEVFYGSFNSKTVWK